MGVIEGISGGIIWRTVALGAGGAVVVTIARIGKMILFRPDAFDSFANSPFFLALMFVVTLVIAVLGSMVCAVVSVGLAGLARRLKAGHVLTGAASAGGIAGSVFAVLFSVLQGWLEPDIAVICVVLILIGAVWVGLYVSMRVRSADFNAKA